HEAASRAAYGGELQGLAGRDRAQQGDRLFPRVAADGAAGRGAAVEHREPGCVPGDGPHTEPARGIPGDAGDEVGGGNDGARDCAAYRSDPGVRACESLPGDEDAPRIAGDEMNEQYLWDRSGAPDPEIERLEQTLAPLRYRHRAEVARMPKPS